MIDLAQRSLAKLSFVSIGPTMKAGWRAINSNRSSSGRFLMNCHASYSC